MKKKLSVQTRINHSTYHAPDGFKSFAQPVYRASTVIFDTAEQLRNRQWINRESYTYGLHGTPTTYSLEAMLCEIEGAEHAVLTPSGLAAITVIDFALLKTGDDVLIPENIYNPNRELGDWLQRDFGVSVRYYDPMIGSGISKLLKENTRLVWAEVPGSITMEVPDIPAIAEATHAAHAVLAVDNTWSAGLVYDAFEHGADIVLQAATKYQGGSSDLLMGAVLTRDDELAKRINIAHMRLGMGVGADDVYLVMRSLSSLKLRYEKAAEQAMVVAQWLKKRDEIIRVLHPSFSDCAGHEIFKRDFTGAGALFSVMFDSQYTQAHIDRLLESLSLFEMGFSWGGTHSLCVPYTIREDRHDWHNRENQIVRFYIGLEDVADLLDDLNNAFKTLHEEI